MITFKVNGDNQLIAELNRAADGIKDKINSALDEVAKHLEKEVKGKFGKYQSGWPKLKRESVIAKYRRKGGVKKYRSNKFTNLISNTNTIIGADNPLILFSELQSSISHEVRESSMEAVVFSDKVYAAVHEYGYKQVPARSYMRLTLWDEESTVVQILKDRIGTIL